MAAVAMTDEPRAHLTPDEVHRLWPTTLHVDARDLRDYHLSGCDMVPVMVTHAVEGCDWSHLRWPFTGAVHDTDAAELYGAIARHNAECPAIAAMIEEGL
jgi:hypothetical protein